MKRKSIVIGLASMVAALVGLGVFADPFHYTSVCDRCGELRRTTDWMLPLSEFTVASHSVQSNSVLARTLSTHGVVGPHTHRWLFVAGGGHGVKCAIGRGRHIMGAVLSAEFASVVVRTHSHGLTGISDRILRGALDPNTSRVFEAFVLAAPKEPTTAAALESWFKEKSEFHAEIRDQTQTGTTPAIPPHDQSPGRR